MKAVLVALVLGACALAYGIGVAWADTGTASPAQSAPATQPVQQEQQPDQPQPRDDCPEKDGGGSSSGSEQNL
jgi:hypothetical protein